MLYGRDPERAKVGELLEAARLSRSGVLVVAGEPGIGKTALLEDTRDRASDMQVLSARGVESESELPFAALHQLLRPAFESIDLLQPAQAAALRGALGLGDRAGEERVLVYAACLSLLSELAERRPVLCLVDDAHWLDAESAAALRFVARRLDSEGVVLVFGVRDGTAHAFEDADLPTLRLEGLGADAAASLLGRSAGVEAAPSVKELLIEQTGGNALALLEVPSVLTAAQLAGNEPLPSTLPLTRHVEQVFLGRVRRLDDGAQRFLLIAAADDSEDVALVARAAEVMGIGIDALATVERAALVVVQGTRLTFRHPLVRSAVYGAGASVERRAAHAALALALAGSDEGADRRAWHLAAAAVEADESAVEALEDAAARAEARGAYTAATRALERAAQLAPDDASRARTMVGAARAASMSGMHDHAQALASRAAKLVDDPLLSAELAQVLATSQMQLGRSVDTIPLLLDAAKQVAPFDGAKALELLFYTLSAASDAGDLEALQEAAELASRYGEGADDDASRFFTEVIPGTAAMFSGDAARGAPLIEHALTWAQELDDPRLPYWASACALWLGDDERCAAIATRAITVARSSGTVGILSGALCVRAVGLFLAQRFSDASVAADEALVLARETGSENFALVALGVLAAVAAVRGRAEEATRLAGEVLRPATERGLQPRVAAARRALALVELGAGRWAEALEHLDAMSEYAEGVARPLIALAVAPDRVEAAVRADRRDIAERALAQFEEWASASPAAWAHARLASCRGLVAEDGDEAEKHFEEAMQGLEQSRPFDKARIQFLYGEHLRRKRRRLDARVQLRQAVLSFESIGAEPWAERARAELRATGETARKREASTVDQLTAQELQIARFVAEGLSNREIAGRLFLSPRTIDSHLRNVFAKLAITSRIQLARIPLGDDDVVEASIETSAV